MNSFICHFYPSIGLQRAVWAHSPTSAGWKGEANASWETMVGFLGYISGKGQMPLSKINLKLEIDVIIILILSLYDKTKTLYKN